MDLLQGLGEHGLRVVVEVVVVVVVVVAVVVEVVGILWVKR